MNDFKEVKKDWWLPAAALVSWGALMLLLPRLPEQVPMHWGISGEVDRWGPKANLVWLGLLPVGLWLLMTLMPLIDPGRANYSRFGKSYRIIRGVIVLLMTGLAWISAIAAGNEDLDSVLFVKVGLGILFVVLGNLLGRIRPNWFTGIRSPWTLADPDIWRRTHRLGGALMVIAGIVFVFSGIFLSSPAGFWIPMAVLIGGVIFDFVYSALLWKKLHGNDPVPPMVSTRVGGDTEAGSEPENLE